MPDNWARNLFDKLQQKSEAERQSKRDGQAEYNRITASAPYTWEGLLSTLQRKVDALNEQYHLNLPQYCDGSRRFLEMEEKSKTEIAVRKRAEPQATLSLVVDYSEPAVKYQLAKYPNPNAIPAIIPGKFQFMLGEIYVCLRDENGAEALTSYEVAERLIENLVT